MPTTNVLIAGCGYIGTALSLRLAAEGYAAGYAFRYRSFRTDYAALLAEHGR